MTALPITTTADFRDLERAQQLYLQARELRESDPRAAFECAHRAALRVGGIAIRHANRTRTRKLPLNVWDALHRMGGRHREHAAAMAPMVHERARLDADPRRLPEPDMLGALLEAVHESIVECSNQLWGHTPAAPLALAS